LKGEIEALHEQLLRSVHVKQEPAMLVSAGMVKDVTSEEVKNKPTLSLDHDEPLVDCNTLSTSSLSSGKNDKLDDGSQGRHKTCSHRLHPRGFMEM